mmetsp:Transcript_608/g.1495  ORF Transcript_608/g.1495 Transcript_608/m.1495 type:complete len:284 (-) Transcript_608:565-1416(-)
MRDHPRAPLHEVRHVRHGVEGVVHSKRAVGEHLHVRKACVAGVIGAACSKDSCVVEYQVPVDPPDDTRVEVVYDVVQVPLSSLPCRVILNLVIDARAALSGQQSCVWERVPHIGHIIRPVSRVPVQPHAPHVLCGVWVPKNRVRPHLELALIIIICNQLHPDLIKPRPKLVLDEVTLCLSCEGASLPHGVVDKTWLVLRRHPPEVDALLPVRRDPPHKVVGPHALHPLLEAREVGPHHRVIVGLHPRRRRPRRPEQLQIGPPPPRPHVEGVQDHGDDAVFDVD